MAHVPQEFSAMEIATDMYQNGILNKSEYRDIISREGAEWSHRDNNAARHLRKALREKGFDSIAYMSKAADHGSIGIIPLDETQLTLVSENGVAVDTDKSVENVGGSGIINTGGKINNINYLKVGEYEAQAKRYYIERVKDSSDITIISQNSGFSIEEISKIKKHMMVNEITFKDGSVRKFDPDIDQALAWKRLIEGTKIKESDILLLSHELEELKIMVEQNLVYEDAHQMANKKYNWEEAIQNFFDEDELYQGEFE